MTPFTLDCVPLTEDHKLPADLLPVGARVRVVKDRYAGGHGPYWGTITKINPHRHVSLSVQGQWWGSAEKELSQLDAVDLSKPGPARAAACEWLALPADADDTTLLAALQARA